MQRTNGFRQDGPQFVKALGEQMDQGHFVAGWGSNGWADNHVYIYSMTSIDTLTQTPGTSHDIHGTSEIS